MKHKESVLQWLLEDDNPPVKYLTLTNILDTSQISDEPRKARPKLKDYDPTMIILDRFDKFINEPDQYKRYWKYTGMYWQFIFLGQFLADGQDERMQTLADQILNDSKWINHRGGQCLTANILRAFMKLGFQDHPTIRQEIEHLAQRIVRDAGIKCEAMEYSLLPRCHMAIPKLLLCFAEISKSERSEAVNEAIQLLVNELFGSEVYKYASSNNAKWIRVLETAPKKKDLPKGHTVKAWLADQRAVFLTDQGFGDKVAKKGWLKFGFPLHYNSDILETMYALALLDVPYSKVLEEPLMIIKDKMTGEGKWVLENSLNGKMLADVEEKGHPSKWITYFALVVLKHFSVDFK